MTAPRWFFPTLAAAALLAGGSFAYTKIAQASNGRWQVRRMGAESVVLDTRTGVICTPVDGGSGAMDSLLAAKTGRRGRLECWMHSAEAEK